MPSSHDPPAIQVLFATPECAPLVKTGGLGDVSAALPHALRALGLDALFPAFFISLLFEEARGRRKMVAAAGGAAIALALTPVAPPGLPILAAAVAAIAASRMRP